MLKNERNSQMSDALRPRAGLVKDDSTPFSSELAFKKTEAGGFFYRERRATAFIERTSYTAIDLATECKLGRLRVAGTTRIALNFPFTPYRHGSR
jgi:hypothetical protein